MYFIRKKNKRKYYYCGSFPTWYSARRKAEYLRGTNGSRWEIRKRMGGYQLWTTRNC